MKYFYSLLVLALAFSFFGCASKKDEEVREVIEVPQAEIGDVHLDVKDGVWNYDSGEVHWYAEKVVGKHDGVVAVKSGSLVMKDHVLQEATFTIDMNTIVVQDLEGDAAIGLAEKLKGENFFNVSEFPEAVITFKSDEGPINYAKGMLTIKGITNEIRFPYDIRMNEAGGGFAEFSAEFSIDRTRWGINYNSGKFFSDLGDKAIKDEIRYKVDLKLKP